MQYKYFLNEDLSLLFHHIILDIYFKILKKISNTQCAQIIGNKPWRCFSILVPSQSWKWRLSTHSSINNHTESTLCLTQYSSVGRHGNRKPTDTPVAYRLFYTSVSNIEVLIRDEELIFGPNLNLTFVKLQGWWRSSYQLRVFKHN